MRIVKRTIIVLLVVVYIFGLIGCKETPTMVFDKALFEVKRGEIVELEPSVQGLKNPVIKYDIINKDIIEQVDECKFKAVNIGETIIKAWIQDYEDTIVEIKITVVEEIYNVIFTDNDGTKYHETTVKEGGVVLKPIDPKKEKFVFVGWYMDKETKTPFDFITQIYEDITLYAKWKELEKSVFIGNDKYDFYKIVNNIEWTKDNFIYPKLVVDGSEKELYMGDKPCNRNRLVSEIGNYKMYFNESTTEIRITKKHETGEINIFHS